MTNKPPAASAKNKKTLAQLPLPLLTHGEKLLHFIWQFGYYNKSGLTTTEGEPITVLFPGTANKNQGPDFSGARIKIGDTTLAGNVELHLKTSDWRKHRHEEDPAYKTVILHAVFDHDESVNNVPVLQLSSRIATLLLDRYNDLMNRDAFIACHSAIAGVKELIWKGWKERLLAERLTRKAQAVLELLSASNHHWDETFWWVLARNLGGTVNGDAFAAMARSVPVNLLAKHKNSLVQLEALLFGLAGLLNTDFEEEYPKLLQREYRFLQKKYGLQPSTVPVAFLRMRPGNFPTVRLAQLAALVHQSGHLFSTLVEAESIKEIAALFHVTANDYWHYHYTFGQTSAFKPKTLGADAVNTVLINAVVPAVFAHGLFHRNEKPKIKALRWLDELPPESNAITKGFQALGIQNASAYDSQALLELRNRYCTEKRCLDCSVGNFLLREAAHAYVPVG